MVQPWCPSQHKNNTACRSGGGDRLSTGCASQSVPAVTPFPNSFWFVKTFKTGGSTLAGVFRAISAHYGIVPVPEWATRPENPNGTLLVQGVGGAMNVSDSQTISVRNHLPLYEWIVKMLRDYTAHTKQRLLMFTAVRHPVSRVHSSFVQDACAKAAALLNPTDLEWQWNQCGGPDGGNASVLEIALANDTVEARWAYVKAHHPANLNYNYVRGDSKTPLEALSRFDFIFVTERMNEALVAFMLEYGLQFEDIAYLSAKNRTGRYKTHRDMPADLNQYIETVNQQELELWKLANKRLDYKIHMLEQHCGSGVFQAALQTFKALQTEVNRKCAAYQAWYAEHGFGPPYAHFGDQGMGPRCLRYAVRRFMAAGGSSSAAAAAGVRQH